LKFEPFSATLKLKPYIDCFDRFEEGLESNNQNQKLQTLGFGCNKKVWKLELEIREK